MPKKDREPEDEKAAEEKTETIENPTAGLDLYKPLDLTVEKVDERISPSETNVFDK